MREDAFDGLVFAGGGCRCFWQAGFYSEVQPRLELAPTHVAAASAGAALACVSLTGKVVPALRSFKAKAAGNRKNVYPGRLFGAAPVFPQAELFRSTIHEIIDNEVLESLRSGPSFRIALTRAPSSIFGVGPSIIAGICAYQLERRMLARVHGQWPKRLGLRVEWAQLNDCESIEALADLLLHTSCTPPFTPAFVRDGLPVLDGGLTDNVPVAALPDCQRILVLLSRPFASLPHTERVVYVQPSRPVPIGAWDYSQPDAIQQAFDLGRRDGVTFAEDWRQELPAPLR